MVRIGELTISANSNDQVTVAAEVNSDEFRQALARGTRFGAWRLNRLKITFAGDDISRYSFSQPVRKNVENAISTYIACRADGHSAAYCNDVLQLALSGPTVATEDPNLQAIASIEPLIPLAWLQKVGSATRTNKAGQVVSRTITTSDVDGKTVTKEIAHIPETDEIIRSVAYDLVDGELGWKYWVQFKPDGSVKNILYSRFDAKEVSQRYKKIIEEVERKVMAEMKQEGIYEQFGSIHTFWHRMKEKLSSKGIMWRSPAEINPHIRYD